MSFRAAGPHKIPIDPNGNLTGKTEGTDTWTYTWNAENQLTKVEKNGSEVARFAYDPRGRRVEKVAGGVAASFAYDGTAILRETRGAATKKYVHGTGIDEPLAVEEGATLTYLHADALGSLAVTTNAAGAVMTQRQFDSWGNLESSADQPGYAFTGREWDPETNLYYYRARYYDPRNGRFISEDPIAEEDQSAFAYADNRPPTSSDPYGLQATTPPPPSRVYYYICCRNGQMTYCAGNTPLRDKCLDDCAQEHERNHTKDFCSRGYGDYCKGKEDATVPRGGKDGIPEKTVAWSECRQNRRSWKCIRKCADSEEKQNMKRDIWWATWENCGKGPSPQW